MTLREVLEVTLNAVADEKIARGEVIVSGGMNADTVRRNTAVVRFVDPRWRQRSEDEVAELLGEDSVRELRSYAGLPGDYVPERLFGATGKTRRHDSSSQSRGRGRARGPDSRVDRLLIGAAVDSPPARRRSLPQIRPPHRSIGPLNRGPKLAAADGASPRDRPAIGGTGDRWAWEIHLPLQEPPDASAITSGLANSGRLTTRSSRPRPSRLVRAVRPRHDDESPASRTSGSAALLVLVSSIPQARRRLHRVPALLAEQKTAISSSYPIEQTPTSGCICNSTPTTRRSAIPAALPSPARAVVLARANAALSELVQCDNAQTRRAARSQSPGIIGGDDRAAAGQRARD